MTPKTKRNLLIVLGVLVLGGLIGWTVIKGKSKKKGVPVEYGEVSSRTIEERVTASGRIFPVTEVAISSDVSGEVVELRVREGDSVKVGELLARVDADAYESQVARGNAGVNAAQAAVATARASIDQALASKKQLEAQLITLTQAQKRSRVLANDGLVSDAELERTDAEIAALQAQLEAADANIRSAEQRAKGASFEVASAQASLKELRTNLRRTNIVSPMTGVVSLLNVEQGERVVGTIQMAGTEMARIADLSQMEVQVEVSENDIPRVTLGDPVDVEVDAYLDRTFKGTVTEISNSANGVGGAAALQSLTSDQVTNFVVTIAIDAASYADLITPRRPYPFRPGMSAAVEILTEAITDAVAVPIAAVTAREPVDADEDAPDGDLVEVVWVVPEGADTVARRDVKTGIQDRAYIQVVRGVQVGERVVVGPYSAVSRKLERGDQVHEKEDKKDDERDDDEDDEG